jgi:hypothetical protein
MIAGSALGYWEVARPSTAHYRHIVRRWGLPTGLDQIDEEGVPSATYMQLASGASIFCHKTTLNLLML